MIQAGPALASTLWKNVGDDWLSYNVETGETCLLSGLARFVIEQLGLDAEPMSLAALTYLVHAEEPEFSRAECDAAIAQAIEALQHAQLLKREGDTMPQA